jgi:hypothetical protein
MKSILTMIFVAGASAASAHPSLVAHEHPHALSALGGLDVLLVAALLAAFTAAAWKWARG